MTPAPYAARLLHVPVDDSGTFEISFDGALLPARTGQSVAAVLIAAGRRSWRLTRREGRRRGIYCGIGVCFDCLVVVNGAANLRACLTPARAGDEVRTQDGVG